MTSLDVASSSNRYVSGKRNPSVPLPVGEVGVERPVRVLCGGQEPILRDAQRLLHALRDLRQPVTLGDRQPCRRHRRRRRGQHEQRLVERHVRGEGVAAGSDLVGFAGAPQQDPPHEPIAPQDAEVVQLRDDLLPRRPGLHGERHVVRRAAGSLAVPVVGARRDHAAHDQQEDDQQGEQRSSPRAAARIVMPVRPARLFLLHGLAGYPAGDVASVRVSASRPARPGG